MTSSAPTDASAASEWRNSKKLVLTAAMGVGLSAAPTYSLGVFIGPLMAEYKWSLGDIVFAQSVMSIIVALTAPLAGILVDKVGVRPLALLGALIISASMAGFAFINGSLVAYYACWVLVALGTTLASVVIWLAPIVSHFSRTRGLAVSITLCGSNLAGAIAPMLAVSLINTSGWQAAYLGLGAYLFVSTVPLALLFFRDQRKPAAASHGVAANFDSESGGLTVGAALRTASFWLLAGSFLLAGGGITAFIVNLVPMLTERGIDPVLAASAVSSLSVAAIIGRLAAGAVMDRVFGPHLAAFVLSLSVIASFVLLWASPTFASALLAAILVGISTGAEFNMLAFLVTKYFGLAHYGRLSGLMFGAFTTGTFFGPVLSGISYQATGSFDQALIGLAICFGVATGLMLLCSPYPRFAPQRGSIAA